jgi:hypothetical protein
MKPVRSFKLQNHTIRISYRKQVLSDDGESLMGDCEPDLNKLSVAKIQPSTGIILDPSKIEHSRWHEQVHLYLYALGRMDLYEDESFVDSLAGYLAQYESTRK